MNYCDYRTSVLMSINCAKVSELFVMYKTNCKSTPFIVDTPGNSHLMTRCLGNYTVKGGYKDFDLFSAAKVEPVIAEAEITGPILLDESCRYLRHT